MTDAYLESMKICDVCAFALRKISELRDVLAQNCTSSHSHKLLTRAAPACCICFEEKKKLYPIGDLHTILNIVLLDAEIELPQERLANKKSCEECISSLNNFSKLRNVVIEIISNQFIEEVEIVKEEETSNNEQYTVGDSDYSECEEEKISLTKINSPESPNKVDKYNKDVHNDFRLLKTGPLKCEECRKVFRNLDQFRNHKKFIHGSNDKEIFICDVCEMGYSTKRGIIGHINSIHKENNHYCPFCEKIYSTDTGVTKHLQKVHNLPELGWVTPKKNVRGGYLICHICSLVCQTEKTLRVHYKQKHKKKPIEEKNHSSSIGDAYCDDCDIQFKNSYCLKMHKLRTLHHVGKKFECSLCDDRFLNKPLLEHHVQYVHENKCIACPVCDKKCSPMQYGVHLKHGHDLPNIRNAYEGGTCHICGHISQNAEGFYHHFREIHSGIPIHCDECEKYFFSKWSLNNHKKRMHRGTRLGEGETEKKEIKLESDNSKVFNRTESASLTKATQGNVFICDTCHTVHKSRSGISGHFMYSAAHAVKKHKCQFCIKTFYTRGLLQKHVSFAHEGTGGHLCPLCGKMCFTASDLSTHLGVHRKKLNVDDKHPNSGYQAEKKFECPQCHMKFLTKPYLEGHIQFAHENKGHPCPICQKVFPPPYALTKHMKAVHFKRKNENKISKKPSKNKNKNSTS